MGRSSFCPASHWGKKKYPRMAPGRGVFQKDSGGEGSTEVSGFQKPPPGELEDAMKDLWKAEGEVFLPCPCSLHPAPSVTVEGWEPSQRTRGRSRAPGAGAMQSWDHTMGQESFTSETTNPGCSLHLKSHLWRGLRHRHQILLLTVEVAAHR